MMEKVMIIAVIAVFFINFIFIDNIYKIIDCPVELPQKSFAGSSKEALIMGDVEKCKKISDLLYKYNITSHTLNDIDDIDKLYPYKYVLAAFNDDLENLSACTITINIMGINNTLATCNKHYNQKIYDANGITTIKSNASDFDIVSLLLNLSKRES